MDASGPPDLSAIEHALRQPLNAIGLFAQVLDMAGDGPPSPAALKGLREAVAALEREIDDLFRTGSGLRANRPTLAGIDAAPQPALPGSTPHSPTPFASWSGLCLVLDDDPAARLGLCLLLEGWGLSVRAFGGLEELQHWLDQAQRPAPALVIADLHLPRQGDGLRAIQRLRAEWPPQSLPVLLLTGDHGLQQVGPDVELMFKPVIPARLQQWVQRHRGTKAQEGV